MTNYLSGFKNKQKIKIGISDDLKSADQTFTGNEFHDYFRRIPFLRLKKFLEKNRITLNGKFLHIASCGTGIDIFYLQKLLNINSDIYVSDLSEEALESTLKIFPGVKGSLEDNEKLSFEDDYFDYSYIAAALHHLPRPLLGLYELLRVSKYGVIVIEPNDTWLTRLATKIGIAQKYEKTGNYVYRISKHEIEKIASSMFSNYYVSRCFATHRVAKNRIEFECLKFVNNCCNIIFPSIGNYIIFIIQKNQKI